MAMAAVVAVLAAAAWGAAPVERLSPRPNTPCLPHCGDNPTAQECADCCRSVPHETDWKCGTDDAAACCVGAWEPACWDVASTNNFMHACDQCIPDNAFISAECLSGGRPCPTAWIFQQLNGFVPNAKDVTGCGWGFQLLPPDAGDPPGRVRLKLTIGRECYATNPPEDDRTLIESIADPTWVLDNVCPPAAPQKCPSCPTTSAAAWNDLKTGDKVGAVAVPLIVGMLIGGGVVYLLVRKDSRGAFRLL